MAFTGYCDKEDVQGFAMEFTFSASSIPTELQVESWIHDKGVEINAVLNALGCVVPVDEENSPEAHRWLKHLNAVGAASIAMASVEGRSLPNTSQYVQRLSDLYESRLEDLREQKLVLEDWEVTSDAAISQPGITPLSYVQDSYLSLDEDTDLAADFRIDKEQEQF